MTFRKHLRNNAIIVFLYWLPVRLLLKIARFFPLQQKIVFNSFSGKGFCDDPKYIFLELVKRNLSIKYIWLVNDLETEMPVQIKKVKPDSWQATYHYLTAKIWIDNSKSNPKPSKRKGQFYLQTWHGSFGIKQVEQAIEKKLPPNYVAQAKADSQKTDLMYSDHDFQINLFKNSFWYNGPVIKSDVPRLSIALNPPKGLKEKIYHLYNISDNQKIILYAPTFRSNGNLAPYKWNYNKILNAFNKKFIDNFVLFIRLHPNIATSKLDVAFSSQIIDVTQYPDMDELMAVSQILITDFSGSMPDMAIAGKPTFLFAKDFDDYITNDRGNCFPIDKIPFPISKTEEELLNNIFSYSNQDQQKKANHFFETIGLEEKGMGDINIANIIIKKLAE